MFVHNFFRMLGALGLTATCVFVTAAETRQWTDNMGKFSLEAELVEIREDSVVLKKGNGASTIVPLARLSDSDRQYLDVLAREQTTTPVRDQAVNLMRTAKYSASSSWNETTYAPAKAFDGLLNTRWNSRSGDARGAWIAARWDKPVTVRQAVVRQAFDRFTGLRLQALNAASGKWRTVSVLGGEALTRQKNGRAGREPNDSSVNPVFTMHLDAPVRTTSLRLLITSVVRMHQGTVSVFEFEALGEPSEEAGEVLQLTKRTEPPHRDAIRANLAFPEALTEPPAWNDANVPFDLAAFLKAPPAEQNAAPLYLDALYEFSPIDMVNLLFPDLSPKELKNRFDSFRPIFREGVRLEEAWEKDLRTVDPVEVDAWLVNFDVGFEKLAAAQRRPRCRFQTGYSIHTLVPHIHAARQVSRVIAWRTRRDLARGDFQRPLDDLKVLLRLSRDLCPGGFAVTQITSVSVDEQCCERVRAILNAPGVDAKICDRLLALLSEHESRSIAMIAELERAEYIAARQALYDLQHRTGTFDPQFMRDELSIEGDTKSPLACIKFFFNLGANDPLKIAKEVVRLQGTLLPEAWTGGQMLSDENYANEVDVVNRFFARILALPVEPNFRRYEAEIKAALVPVNETTLASFVVPAIANVFATIRRREAQVRGTQCLVALRRWQLEHAGEPPDLETLVQAARMPNVPIDPFSGQPLRMAAIDGKTVIYSVGPDGKDDEAKVQWKFGSRNLGDFVLRLDVPSQ